MAFEGDLTNLGLADIFQTLGMNRQSGTLVVKHGDTERRFYFTDDGVSLLTTRSARKFRLGNLLVGMGKISESDLKVAVLKQERAKDTKLGDLLVQTGLVQDTDIEEACKYQAAEEIYDSFNWRSGKFQFLEGANAGPAGGPGPFAEFFFQVTDIVMEAARRSDEFSLNLQKIGEQEEFFARRSEDPLPEGEFDRPVRLLYQTLDGTLNVAQVFDDFYLSPFDTSNAFVTLIEKGLVITMDAESLRGAAAPFLERKEFARAARMLARAAKLAPEDAGLLEALAEAQASAGDRKEASRSYAALGVLLKSGESRTEALEALKKAIAHDSRNGAAYETLMEVYGSLDQFGKAEEACREAARLLSDDRDFQTSLRLLDRGLGIVPDSIPLRLQRANCLLAMDQKDEGMTEMRAVAAEITSRKTDPRLALGVFRKLQQLDPDNREYAEQVTHLLAGEKARETRRRLLRVGAVLGVVGLLVTAWFLRPKTAAERLAAAEAAVAAGDPEERNAAEETAREVLRNAAEGSDLAADARALIERIDRLRAAPERARKVAELEKRIRDTVLGPAEALTKEGDYAGAATKLLEIIPEMQDTAHRAIEGDELNAMWKRVQAEYLRILMVPATGLREDWKAVQAAQLEVGNIDLAKADEERQRMVLEVAGKALESVRRTDWNRTMEALNDATGRLAGVDSLRMADLRMTLTQLEQSVAILDDTWNRARAEVQQREVRAHYSSVLEAVQEAKESGAVQRGIEACEKFLARCEEVRRAEPRRYFAPVLDRLFTVLKLDVEARAMRDSLKAIADGIARAREAEAREDYQAAFDILKKTISGAQDVSFQGLARLPLKVTTRPPGAELTVADGSNNVLAVLKTPCVIHYPYQGRTLLHLRLAGYDPGVVERTGIAGDREAHLNVDLQRTVRWATNVGAAVEGRPGIARGLVLVGTRGGLFRALSAETGDEVFQVDTKNLSGISSGILVSGDRAFFGGNDGEAFAVDLVRRALAWRKPTGAAVEKAPVACGGVVVFGDALGTVRGLDAATGEVAWTKETGIPVSGGLLAVGDAVAVALADGRLLLLKGSDGTEIWSRKLSGPVYGSLGDDGRGGILAGTDASVLERVAVAGGAVTWSAKTDAPVHARPVVRGDTVHAVTTRGTVGRYALSDGKEQAVISLGIPVEGGARAHGDMLYISASRGSLVAYSLATAEVVWRRGGLGQLVGEPGCDGEILVAVSADSSGAVTALRP